MPGSTKSVPKGTTSASPAAPAATKRGVKCYYTVSPSQETFFGMITYLDSGTGTPKLVEGLQLQQSLLSLPLVFLRHCGSQVSVKGSALGQDFGPGRPPSPRLREYLQSPGWRRRSEQPYRNPK
jgi:hypothetical protein